MAVVKQWWCEPTTACPPDRLDFCPTDRRTSRDVATFSTSIALTPVPFHHLLPGYSCTYTIYLKQPRPVAWLSWVDLTLPPLHLGVGPSIIASIAIVTCFLHRLESIVILF
jgi:hypothetical protein